MLINTTLVPQLPIDQVAGLAEYQAKRALACGRSGDANGFAVHTNKMYDVLEAARYPTLTAIDLVTRLGRGKAMVLKIERKIINLAV